MAMADCRECGIRITSLGDVKKSKSLKWFHLADGVDDHQPAPAKKAEKVAA